MNLLVIVIVKLYIYDVNDQNAYIYSVNRARLRTVIFVSSYKTVILTT